MAQMKATDIMINDWVYLSEATKYAMRVTSVDENNCYLDFEGNEGEPFDGIYGEDGIAPIPLTVELLKLNGWRRGSNLRYISKRPVDISLSGDNEHGFLFQISDYTNTEVCVAVVDYVHTLQHILRICGYNDVADNFKIK